jgi:hypothetical protein
MANIISHELDEGVNDPNLNAWYDTRGFENRALCSWLYGNVTDTIGNGVYNENFGGKNWLLQMNFEDARGGGCDNYLGGPLSPRNSAFSVSTFSCLGRPDGFLLLAGIFSLHRRTCRQMKNPSLRGKGWVVQHLTCLRSSVWRRPPDRSAESVALV